MWEEEYEKQEEHEEKEQRDLELMVLAALLPSSCLMLALSLSMRVSRSSSRRQFSAVI